MLHSYRDIDEKLICLTSSVKYFRNTFGNQLPAIYFFKLMMTKVVIPSVSLCNKTMKYVVELHFANLLCFQIFWKKASSDDFHRESPALRRLGCQSIVFCAEVCANRMHCTGNTNWVPGSGEKAGVDCTVRLLERTFYYTVRW